MSYNQDFLDDVNFGLLKCEQKMISSKWKYDKNGDDMFVKLMSLPEYYVARYTLCTFKSIIVKKFNMLYLMLYHVVIGIISI